MNPSGWRPRYGPSPAARWVAVTLSLLAHGAAAAWIFNSPGRPVERRIEIPIEVTTAPLVDEPLAVQQPAPPEVPSTRHESEVVATEPQQLVEPAPKPPAAAAESNPSELAPDTGPTETVPAAPPPSEMSGRESQPPVPEISPEEPPAATVAKPSERIESGPQSVPRLAKPPARPSPAKNDRSKSSSPANRRTPRERPKAGPRQVETQRKAATAGREAAPQGRSKAREKPTTARKSSTAQRSASQRAATSTKTDPRAQANYMAGITARLLARKYFPPGAPSGSLVVNFSVGSSGKLLAHGIARSSGSPILDKVALHIVESAAPFPPFPKGMNASHVNFSVPMTFSRR